MGFLNWFKPWLLRTISAHMLTDIILPESLKIPLVPGSPANETPEGILVARL